MLKKVASRVAWVGRTASMVFGLALVLALLFGVASMALGATGDNFILGNPNVANAITKLTGNVVGGPALQVVNNKTEPGSRGLQVGVAANKPPILVNATAGKATNLNADKVDGVSLGCPSGTLFHEGVCIETTLRGENVPFATAQADCLDEPGTRLPTPAELQTLEGRNIREVSNHAYSDFGGSTSQAIVLFVDSEGKIEQFGQGSIVHYRCVKQPR